MAFPGHTLTFLDRIAGVKYFYHRFFTAGRGTLVRMLKTQHVRRALILGCGMQMFAQLSGINTVM